MAQIAVEQREEILNLLRLHKHEIADRYGVTELGLFGSMARGDANAVSDVDIVVKTRIPDPYLLVDLRDDLERLLGMRVDIVRYWQRMNPYLKRRIDREARYV
ncbi:MAG: nucleotidyltransferase domain-containing protein [Desulfatitalea sp.]